MKYLFRVTESINHDYMIEAETEEEAMNIYHNYTMEQLQELDLDGQSSWDSYPWDVEKLQDLDNEDDTK
jgi:hypothetical protein